MRKVELTIIKSGNSKLGLIKIIKDYIHIGLREAKDFVDNAGPLNTMSIEMDLSAVAGLKTALKVMESSGLEFILKDIVHHRNKSIIELGIYDREDLIEYLSEVFTEECISGEIRTVLHDIFSTIKEDRLKDIYESYLQYKHDKTS
jgi:hypothetical protein